VDFLDALRVLARRWYLVLAGLFLIAAASGAAIHLVPTNYQASGSLLLLLPAEATGKSTPTNPYLNLEPGLTSTASLIAGTVSTKDTRRELAKDGYKSKYSVALNPGTGPLLVISVEDTNPAAAIATRDAVVQRLDAELKTMQVEVDVPNRQFIHSRPSSVGKAAEALPGSKIRALAAVVGVGATLTLIFTFTFDRFRLAHLVKRAEKREEEQPEEPESLILVSEEKHPDERAAEEKEPEEPAAKEKQPEYRFEDEEPPEDRAEEEEQPEESEPLILVSEET
jgi:hypothetical protein